MKTSGVNLKPLCQSGASASDCVDAVLVSTDFERLIEHAQGGDKAAAKELLALASSYLTSEIFGPFPLELRRYLGIALATVSLGESADIALHLKNASGGRPRKEHRTKLRLGHLIYRIMKAEMTNDDEVSVLRARIDAMRAEGTGRAGATLDEASDALREHIKAGIKENGTYYGYRKTPSTKRLEAIYNEVLPEIESTYKGVSSEMKSTLKT
jgi:hypothetical protein